MSTPPSQQNDFLAARAESCRLLGLNPDDLSPHEMIRCDLLTVLRLWLDGSQSALLSGGTADPTKILAVADVLGKLVPEPEHRSRGEDPRQIMWETYVGMRRRGEIAGPEYSRDAALKRIAELEAEIAALRAGAPAPDEPTLASPLPDNVVPLPRPTNAPASSPPASAAPAAPQPQAAPAYDPQELR